MIDYIKIFSLHGEMDVCLNFDSSVKIIIGDNGSGKTTVLSALYYILTKDFIKLNELSFEKIELKIIDCEKIVIEKKDLYYGWDLEELGHPLINEFLDYISKTELIEILTVVSNNNFLVSRKNINFIKIVRNSEWSSKEIYDRLSYIVRAKNNRLGINSHMQANLFEGNIESARIEKAKSIITEKITEKILYLPTYRRVEETIKNFGYIDEDSIVNSPLIKFGMEDVEKRFKRIQSELKNSAVKLYTNLNGKMLTQLASYDKVSEDDFEKIKNTDALKIVFARVGNSILPATEKSILTLIDNGTIRKDRYHPLVFVLSNLIDVYNQQKETDDSIKSFIVIANKYLVNKEFIYDENNVEISVFNKKSGNVVALEKLSSGEKQLISLFSLLYLEKEENYIVIFDEPELSLSIEWQEMLLPDMLDSKKCKFLVAATHSPFIFNNELDNNTGIIEVTREY